MRLKNSDVLLTSNQTFTLKMTKPTYAGMVDGGRRVRFPLPAEYLAGHDIGSVWFDEAHEMRRGKTYWEASDSVANVSLLKVFMTATPLTHSPDVSHS